VYAYSSSCSGWVDVRTLAPPSPPPPPPPGANGNGQPPPPKHVLRTPNLTATSGAPTLITLSWGPDTDSSDLYTLGNIQLYRDGQITFDAKKYGGYTTTYNDGGPMYDSTTRQWSGQMLRMNTEYTYRVCFIGYGEAQGQTKCSTQITAMGKPVPPTPPADVTYNRARMAVPGTGRTARLTTQPKTVVTANWRKPDLARNEVPGQFIAIERQDRGLLGRGAFAAVGQVWKEIARIPAKTDPTTYTVDVTPTGLQLGTQAAGNTYRICALVPILGPAGTACAVPVVVP